MISAEAEGRLAYMTYPDPWRGAPKQQPEFLRPQPKPLAAKYGAPPPAAPNGARLAPAKYSPPAHAAPVNLAQHAAPPPPAPPTLKEEMADDLSPAYAAYRARAFPAFPAYYPQVYPGHYQPVFRPTAYVDAATHLAASHPLDGYAPPPPAAPVASTNSGTFLSPPAAYSPPNKIQATKPHERRIIPPAQHTQNPHQNRIPSPSTNGAQNFKVPSGKEGSLKHRLLLRPEEGPQKCAIDLHKTPATPPHQEVARKRLSATAASPPRSPASKTAFNCSPASVNFAKGCLIQLENGDLKKLEEMKTEDFVHSAEISPELRLADSTVVKIGENPITGSVAITLTYNQRRTEAEVEYPLEHPFFVYGKGWASCNPDRTLKSYSLRVHRLQVGDVIISLTPRSSSGQTSSSSARPSAPTDARTRIGATYTTTATTTAVTARQVTAASARAPTDHSISHITGKQQQQLHQQQHLSADQSPEALLKKRRWSAPGQIGDDEVEEGTPRLKPKIE